MNSNTFLTAALYKFVSLPDFVELKQPLLDCCNANNVKGTLLLALEGINGTISGPAEGIHKVLAYLRADPRLADLEHKESHALTQPFHRMKVKLKKEIVSLGVPTVDPTQMVGRYVKPEDWNALITDPDVVLVDTRNNYEVALGTFANAIDPKTMSFTQFPKWVEDNKDVLKKPKLAMFCTGGIRCEKSTAFMLQQGYEEVYHLQGGILKYLEVIPEEKSLWKGECFVFDERVSVGQGLKPGKYEFCRACRHPITAENKLSEHFILGVSCPSCYFDTTEDKKRSFAERQRQVELAEKRHQQHIGAAHVKKTIEQAPVDSKK